MADRYLISLTQEDALKLSGDEATARGCGLNPDDVTRFWWPVEKHPTREEWSVIIEEGDEGSLPTREIQRLVTKETAEADGYRTRRAPRERTEG